ncbi:MAG: hypothetical protein J6D06_05510 [Clostridia bacterium]|nr:hypothetical protein [Clostridia bacterium]
MLDSIWQLLANYGLDVKEIADAIHSLVAPVVDAEGNVVGYEGTLASIVDFPVIGSVLKGFADFAPSISDATDTVA